jgi:hypothetical protein
MSMQRYRVRSLWARLFLAWTLSALPVSSVYADAFLNKLDEAVERQLESDGAVQKFVFRLPKSGKEISVDIVFSNSLGVPESGSDSAGGSAEVRIPRRFLIGALGWMDALAMSEGDPAIRADLKTYAEAYRSTNALLPAPYWKRIGSEPSQASPMRQDPDYSTRLQRKFLSTIFFIQTHEFSHILLEHGTERTDLSVVEREGEADGGGVVLFQALTDELPESEAEARTLRNALPSLMTLTNQYFLDPSYPDVICRVQKLVGDDFDDVLPVSLNCSEYNAAFDKGAKLMTDLIDSGLSFR